MLTSLVTSAGLLAAKMETDVEVEEAYIWTELLDAGISESDKGTRLCRCEAPVLFDEASDGLEKGPSALAACSLRI